MRAIGSVKGRGEAGNASVEFVGVACLLLVPLIYLVLVAGQLQAATLASATAAREAGRALVSGPADLDERQARERAELAALLAFEGQGLADDGRYDLRIRCEQRPCRSPGGAIEITARVRVALPGLAFAAAGVAIPVEARHVAIVDRFGQGGR